MQLFQHYRHRSPSSIFCFIITFIVIIINLVIISSDIFVLGDSDGSEKTPLTTKTPVRPDPVNEADNEVKTSHDKLHSSKQWSFVYEQHQGKRAVQAKESDEKNREEAIQKALFFSEQEPDVTNAEDVKTNNNNDESEKSKNYTNNDISNSDGTTPPPPVVTPSSSSSSSSSHPLKPSFPTFTCQPGSTAEGIWGLNSDPYFSSPEFYFETGNNNSNEQQSQQQQSKSSTLSTQIRHHHHHSPKFYNPSSNKPFGKWIVMSNRTLMMMRFCRHKKGIINNKTTPMWRFCDWHPKPHGFNPFAGSRNFWVNETMAIYVRPSFSSSSSSADPGLLTPREKKIVMIPLFPRPARPTSLKPPPPLSFCYDFQSAFRCLRNKIVVFFGDSHVLNLVEVLCRMIVFEGNPKATGLSQGICGGFDARFIKHMNVVNIPRWNVTLALLRVRYNLKDQMYRFDSHYAAKFLEGAHFVVIGRGMWDLVYKDTPRKMLTEQYSETLKYLAHRFKFAKIIVKMVHYDHKHMDNCSSDDRLMEVRESNICSVYIAQTAIAQEAKMIATDIIENQFVKKNKTSIPSFLKNYDPYSRVSILDSYGMTREVPYNRATDHLGHHYEGSVMESMTQQMLSVFCPVVPQNHSRIYHDVTKPIGKIACERVMERAETEKRIPKCSCNDVEFGGYQHPEALDYCKKFYAVSNREVAYFTDV